MTRLLLTCTLALLLSNHADAETFTGQVHVQPPSIHDWIKKGSIGKDKLPELWRFFSDVVGPEHWGLSSWPAAEANIAFSESNAEQAGRPRTMRPVKIKGYAKLGDDGYYEETECDGWVDSYSPDPDAYGLRVKGDSMHPAIRNGSVVVVEPAGQLVPGEYVAIALTRGKKMVKELVFDRPDEIVVESVNGNQRQTIERHDIETIHPVAAVVSPSKWRAE